MNPVVAHASGQSPTSQQAPQNQWLQNQALQNQAWPSMEGQSVNVGESERLLSMFGAGALVACGLMRGNLTFLALGGALAYRGLTGQCHVYQALGLDTSDQDFPERDQDSRGQVKGHELDGPIDRFELRTNPVQDEHVDEDVEEAVEEEVCRDDPPHFSLHDRGK